MRIKIATISLMVFTACVTPAKIPTLKGTYLNAPFQITTESNKEVVWDKIIDMFSQKGLPIKLIDRSSGLIISEKSILKSTYEDGKGGLVDKTAWVVGPSTYGTYTKKQVPYYKGDILGEWNIRIKEAGKGTSVNVNIVNLHHEYGDLKTTAQTAKSTGTFEKIIADLIK